jgi:hypothetical protein
MTTKLMQNDERSTSAWFIVLSAVIKKESRTASDSSVEVGNN